MAEHLPAGPAEVGAPMDYPAHEHSYERFLGLTKIVILAAICTVLALALFGFGAGGFWLGTVLVLLMLVATTIGLATNGGIKPLVIVTIIGFVFLALSVS